MEHWWQYAALAVYVLLLVIIIPRHEPWTDEAQAWLLARDAPPWQLVTAFIRYEGTPALWHLLLAVPAHLGLPYATVKVVSGVLATVSAFLVLRCSPLPTPIRLLLPFSYFLAYQYAVVARSYVLLEFLVLLAAATWRRRYDRPGPFALTLAVLANVSLHGLIIGGVLAGFFLLGLIRRSDRPTAAVSRHAGYLLVMGTGFAVSVFQLIPPPDLVFPKGYATDIGLIWTTIRLRVNGAFATYWWATMIVLLASTWWLWRKRVLALFVALMVPLLMLFSVKYSNPWHEGILLLVWTFALWVAFDQEGNAGRRFTAAARQGFVAIVCVILLGQVWWTAQTYWREYWETYSAAGDVAAYIAQQGLEDERLFATSLQSVAIQPYFDRNIFYNYNNGEPYAFWRWSTDPTLDENLARIPVDQPELVVWGIKSPQREALPDLGPDYQLVAVFDGNILWKGDYYERDAAAVFRRVG